MKKNWLFLIFGMALFVSVFTFTVSAVTTPHVVTVSYPTNPYEMTTAYYEVKADNLKAGETASYLWYTTIVSCVNSDWLDDDGWFKGNDDFTWLFDYDKPRIKIKIGEWADRDPGEHFVLRCKVTVKGTDGKKASAYSQIFEVFPQKAENIYYADVTGSSLPKYDNLPPTSYKPRQTSYSVENVTWSKWDEASGKWNLMKANEKFSEGQYREIIRCKTKEGYKFQTVSSQKMICTIDASPCEIGYYSDDPALFYLIKEYNISKTTCEDTYVTKVPVCVYESPSFDSMQILCITKDHPVTVLETTKDGWGKIRLNNAFGWLYLDNLEKPHDKAWYTVISGAVNIRSGPGIGYDRVGGISYGGYVYYDGAGGEDGWLKVTSETRITGWIDSSYLALSPGKTLGISPVKYTINASAVNVRSDAGTNYGRIGGLTKGKTIIATGRKIGTDGKPWIIFEYDGQLGYIMESLLTDASGKPAVPQTTAEDEVIDSIPATITLIKGKKSVFSIPAGGSDTSGSTVKDLGNGDISFNVTPEEGKTYPDDTTKIKIDLGGDTRYEVKSITKNTDGSVTVTLKSKEQTVVQYTVRFEMNGYGVAPGAQKVNSGSKVAKPSAPTAKGMKFIGWYADKALKSPYDFNTAVKSDLTIYAKWEKENQETKPLETKPEETKPIETKPIETGSPETTTVSQETEPIPQQTTGQLPVLSEETTVAEIAADETTASEETITADTTVDPEETTTDQENSEKYFSLTTLFICVVSVLTSALIIAIVLLIVMRKRIWN